MLNFLNTPFVTSNKLCKNSPIINGPTEGIFGNTYEYEIYYFDPEDDDIYYKIYWGDCMVIMADGPYKSGEIVKYRHCWCEICCGPGIYTIMVKAFNKDGYESEWGTLDVNLKPKKNNLLFRDIINQILLNPLRIINLKIDLLLTIEKNFQIF
jgi:hypothetical protein